MLQLPPWQSPRELPRRTIRKIAPRRFISISLRYWHQSRRTVTSQKLVAPLARLWIFTLVHLGTERKGKNENKKGENKQRTEVKVAWTWKDSNLQRMRSKSADFKDNNTTPIGQQVLAARVKLLFYLLQVHECKHSCEML